MCENAYLSIKNPKASRALKWALDLGHRLLASLAWLHSATLATFDLRSWAPLDQILDLSCKLFYILSKNLFFVHFLTFLSTQSEKKQPNRLCDFSVYTIVQDLFLKKHSIETHVWFVVHADDATQFLIGALSFLTFAVDPILPQNRLQLTFTLVLTAVAFKFVVNQSLPNISYLTYLVSRIFPKQFTSAKLV